MRIAIIAKDTRGGVQPYVALGIGLHAAGHDVRMVVPDDSGFEVRLAAVGIPVVHSTGSPEALIRGGGPARAQAALAGKLKGGMPKGTVSGLRLAARMMREMVPAWTQELVAACSGVDMVVGGIGGMIIGRPVAEHLRIPFVEAQLQPIGPATSAYPGVLVNPPRWLGGFGRKMSHRLTALGIQMPFRSAMAQARADLGLPKKRLAPPADQPILFGYSRHVVPKPPEWGPNRHVTGYWNLPADDGWLPPDELDAFLAAGPPPVCIGFGSMPSDNPAALAALVVDAVRRARVRAVVVTGWGALASVPTSESILPIAAAPFDWLFPRMAAVVHHGGAGTTGAALAAGSPAVVIPFGVDQPFWGGRVFALGAGPRPIPFQHLSAAALANALGVAATDTRMRERAAAVGRQIRAEEGVATAVAVLNRYAVGRARDSRTGGT